MLKKSFPFLREVFDTSQKVLDLRVLDEQVKIIKDKWYRFKLKFLVTFLTNSLGCSLENLCVGVGGKITAFW